MQIELVYATDVNYVKEGTLIGISIENTKFYLEGYDSGQSKNAETLELMSENFKKHGRELLELVVKTKSLPYPPPPEPPPKRHFVNEKQINPPLVKDRKRLDP